MSYKDIIGEKFNRLTVLKRAGSDKHKNAIWECVCECGNKVIASTHSLRSNNTKSCGCLQKEKATKHLMDISITHGLSRTTDGKHTRLFRIWQGMKSRCSNTKLKEYPRYGGSGIKVCDEWLNNYQAFYDWAMQNGYNDQLTLDRINNGGNYEPSNCRWVDEKVQANNRKDNKIIEFNGERKTLSEWADKYGIKYSVVFERLKRGWFLEKALTHPVQIHRKKV